MLKAVVLIGQVLLNDIGHASMECRSAMRVGGKRRQRHLSMLGDGAVRMKWALQMCEEKATLYSFRSRA